MPNIRKFGSIRKVASLVKCFHFRAMILAVISGLVVGVLFPTILYFLSEKGFFQAGPLYADWAFILLCTGAGIFLSALNIFLFSRSLLKSSEQASNLVKTYVEALQECSTSRLPDRKEASRCVPPFIQELNRHLDTILKEVYQILYRERVFKELSQILTRERNIDVVFYLFSKFLLEKRLVSQMYLYSRHRDHFIIERRLGEELIPLRETLSRETFLFEAAKYGEFLNVEDLLKLESASDLIVGKRNYTFFQFTFLDKRAIFVFRKDDRTLDILEYLCENIEPFFDSAVFYTKLKEKTYVDDLTRVHNRRYGLQKLKEFLLRTKHSNRPFALFLFDLNNFKTINDKYGHSAGDLALKKFAKAVKALIREQDVFARYGGDEFILLAREMTSETAKKLKARLQRNLEKLSISVDGTQIPVRAAIGYAVAFGDPSLSIEDLLTEADEKMYEDKQCSSACKKSS